MINPHQTTSHFDAQRCPCGGFRLKSGPVTLHMTPEEFQGLLESMRRLSENPGEGSRPCVRQESGAGRIH
jgi:hypothetical protein